MKKFKLLSCLFVISNWFVSLAEECGSKATPQVLTATSRAAVLYTPGYNEGHYKPNLDCHWVIRSSLSYSRIQLDVSYSQLEDSIFTSCDDFLEVRDGPTKDSAVLARWCGHAFPLSVTSTQSKILVRFKTDSVFELRGANLSFISYAIPGCPNGWREWTDSCYRLFGRTATRMRTWAEAQKQCFLDGANLVTISNHKEYGMLLNTFSETVGPWVGVSDAEIEGNFQSINPNHAIWPESIGSNLGDHSERDCVFLDASSSTTFNVDDCRKRRPFICKKRKDGSTASYAASEHVIQKGMKKVTTWSYLNLWPLLLVIIILLLLILLPLCFHKCKEKKTERRVSAATVPVLDQVSPRYESTTPVLVDNGLISRKTSEQIDKVPDGKIVDERNYSQSEILVQQSPLSSKIKNRIQVSPQENEKGFSNQQTNGGTRVHYELFGPANNGGHEKDVSQILPPIDRFGRPNVRLLDNVSALSMEEFWNNVDGKPSERYTPSTGRTMF